MSSASPTDRKHPAYKLWTENGLPEDRLNRLHLTKDPDPCVDSSFRLGTVAQTSIGLAGLSAAYFHELRTSVEQDVSVNARHAIIEFKSEVFYGLNGKTGPRSLWDELAGIYPTEGGGYTRIHTNFPHHRQGILDILQCQPTRDAVAQSLKDWDAVEFETEVSRRGMVATALRSFDEWDEHPQAKALLGVPPVSVVKVADAPKRKARGNSTRSLEGIRVLDLTRVLAGPVCGRTLAAHGADVLLVTSPNLPSLPDVDVDTSRGKRTTQLDLNDASDRETLASLVKGADVFLQAYRPGGLDAKGFGVDDVVKSKPGIVYASLCAYGWDGPWKNRRGFDSLVQTATGFNIAEAEAYTHFTGQLNSEQGLVPKTLPMQAIDHAAGYLLAYGINSALCKTILEGGSWEVRVSLAAVAQWIRSLGRIDPAIAFGRGQPLPASPQSPEVVALSVPYVRPRLPGDEGDSKPETMRAIKHAAILSETPVVEHIAPMVLNANPPVWG